MALVRVQNWDVVTYSEFLFVRKFLSSERVGREMITQQGKYIYNTSKELGKGSSGTVYEGEHFETRQPVAVKVITNLKVNGGEQLEREIRILKLLSKYNHPHILQCYHTEIDIEADKAYIITERCDEDLSKYLIKNKKLRETEAKLIIQQLVSALQIVRKEFIVHRDLKPANIFVNLTATKKIKSIKLADFGLAREANDNSVLESLKGTPVYMSKEVFEKNYTQKADLWSLGVVLYQLMEGGYPYMAKSFDSLYEIIRDKPIPKLTVPASPELIDLLERLMEKNSEERIDWGDLFLHPWIYPPILRYFDEISLLALSKSSSYEYLGQALLLYFAYLTRVSEFMKTPEANEFLREQFTKKWQQHWEITKKLVAGNIQPTGSFEQIVYRHAMNLARLGIESEVCDKFESCKEYYTRSLILLRGLSIQVLSPPIKQELFEHIQVFDTRLRNTLLRSSLVEF